MSTWIVTGASRGLGRQLALQLAARRQDVVAIARESAELRSLAAEGSGRVRALPLDLCRRDLIGPTLHGVLQHGGEFAGLINNAGIGRYAPLLEHDEGELLDVLQVNLGAVMQLTHALLPRLIAQGHGHIVNIGSDLGRRPLANMAAYVASKHGLTGFSHSLLREVRQHGLRVRLIQPGMIDTGFGGNTEGSRGEVQCLAPEALARLVLQVIDASASMVIDELTVHPLGQPEF